VVYAVNAASTSLASKAARNVFEQAAELDLHLALIDLPTALTLEWLPDLPVDTDTITCLRSVLMKPEHKDWTERIVALLERSAA